MDTWYAALFLVIGLIVAAYGAMIWYALP